VKFCDVETCAVVQAVEMRCTFSDVCLTWQQSDLILQFSCRPNAFYTVSQKKHPQHFRL